LGTAPSCRAVYARAVMMCQIVFDGEDSPKNASRRLEAWELGSWEYMDKLIVFQVMGS
jgi:hypothetical protein